MKLADNVEMLEIEGRGAYYPTLLWDEQDVVLIDTGFPGELESIRGAMQKAGFAPEQLTKVILTHQDIDHIGSARLLRDAGAQIMAYETEAPAIQGDEPLIKVADMEAHLDELPAAQQAFYHQLKDAMPSLVVPVDVLLSDGQELAICGGIQVIHTPGHTPGHISLLLSESNIAVCGDAANINEGKLVGANPGMTHDMTTAAQSYAKLAALDVAGYVCYHTGYLAK